MRRLLLAVVALTLVPVTTSHGASEPLPVTPFACTGISMRDPNDPTRRTGVLYGAVAVADLPSRDGVAGNPSTVTLTCSLQAASYRHYDPDDFTATGSAVNGAVVAPAPFSVPEPADEWPLGVCARVDVSDANGTRTYWQTSNNGMWIESEYHASCSGAPQCWALGADCNWYLALVQWLSRYANDVSGAADPALCPYLVTQSPGVPGVVDVTPDGDVYVAGTWVWDCPPYGS